MADYGFNLQTAQISTGNVATVNDPFVSATTPTGTPNTAQTLSGAVNPLGRRYDGVVTSASNVSGYPVAYRYVRYNCTTPPALVSSGITQNVPGLVYWKDETFTIVTSVQAEALGGSINANNSAAYAAGVLLNPSVTNGNYVFIQVAGLLPKCVVPTATTIGDQLLGTSATSLAFTRAAANSALAQKVVAWGASVSSGNPNLGDIMIALEPM